jgi:hypothetical protein
MLKSYKLKHANPYQQIFLSANFRSSALSSSPSRKRCGMPVKPVCAPVSAPVSIARA